MSESGLWREIKKNIGHKGHFSRIESHATSCGFPDVEFHITKQGTIELKFSDKEAEAPEIRPSQVRWHRDRNRVGGNCWFFAKLKINKRWWYFLIPGTYVDELAEAKSNADWFNVNGFRWEKSPNWSTILTLIS